MAFSLWESDDLNFACSLWGDELVTKYISKMGRFSQVEIEAKLALEMENQREFSVQYWPIFERSTHEFIGCCGLRPYDVDAGVYEIGFHLKPSHWGKGLGPEVAVATIEYARSHLGAKELFAGHNPHNVNSKKVLERLGFQYIGDEFYEPTGLYHPSYKYTF